MILPASVTAKQAQSLKQRADERNNGMPLLHQVARDMHNIGTNVLGALDIFLNGENSAYYGGGASQAATSSKPFTVKDGEVQFKNSQMQAAADLINKTAMSNNEWSALQAEKQMQFQLMMSNTAHQREVQDLLAAGLNPVLSAGGNGAQVTSGAMGQTDTSNTALIGELAVGALEAMQNTAVGVAAAAGGSGGMFRNKFVQMLGNGFARGAGYQIARGIFGPAASAFKGSRSAPLRP